MKTISTVLTKNALASLGVGSFLFSDVSDLTMLTSDNYRKVEFDSDEYQALKVSIAMTGVREPIKLIYDISTKTLAVIAGHHRTAVVAELRSVGNYTQLPLVVQVINERDEKLNANIAVSSAVSNIAKVNLKSIDRAEAMKKMLDSGMRIVDIANALGLNRKVIERSLNVAALPDDLKDIVKSGAVKESKLHALAQKYKNDINDGLSDVDAKRLFIDALDGGAEDGGKIKRVSKTKLDISAIESELTKAGFKKEAVVKVMGVLENCIK